MIFIVIHVIEISAYPISFEIQLSGELLHYCILFGHRIPNSYQEYKTLIKQAVWTVM